MKHVVTTQTYGYRLQERPLTPPDKTLGTETVTVDPKTVHQTIIGFGGAFTEASAYNLSRVSENVRKRVIKAYFNPDEGIGYTLGRVSVHGCDFSLGSYLYIDDYDDTLESFSIERDRPVINMIKDASRELGQDIRVLASPWTPPFWMKDNHSPIRGGKLIPSYDGIWARYLAKFVETYRKEGIDIFALTLQNEPMAVQRWDSCIYEDEDEVRFLKVLGKTLHEQGLEDVRLYIWDHNRDLMVRRAQAVYSDPEAARYAYGTAFHWYENEQFEEVGKHKTLFPDKHLLFTEGCQENGPHFGDWSVGIRYGRNIINDLMNGNEGHIDWNLVLDDTGGPNHVNNLCSSPVMLKIFNEEVVLNPSYHVMGQFSKFIRPGAKRLHVDMSGSLKAVAFENTDGSQVLVVMNETDNEVNLRVTGLKALVETTVHAKAFHTFVL
jgi:glucosylceramidase